MIRQMVGGGYLSIDVAGYGGLSLSPKGHALMQWRGEIPLPPGARRSHRRRRNGRASSWRRSKPIGVSEELLQRLKPLRAKLARERGVPAYVIFADRTLIDMAAKRPLTRWDFGEVHGVGEIKLQQFAEVFLAEIRGHVQEGSEL